MTSQPTMAYAHVRAGNVAAAVVKRLAEIDKAAQVARDKVPNDMLSRWLGLTRSDLDAIDRRREVFRQHWAALHKCALRLPPGEPMLVAVDVIAELGLPPAAPRLNGM